MRIIGGHWRGANLFTPDTDTIRPTSDKVRQALFNILINGLHLDFTDTKILDICAGTGALGFEALSHGAASCHFIDNDADAISLVKRNAQKLKCEDKIKTTLSKVENLTLPQQHFDVVFIDPPYQKNYLEIILPQLIKNEYIDNNSFVICEESKYAKLKLDEFFDVIDHRVYGKTQIFILKIK